MLDLVEVLFELLLLRIDSQRTTMLSEAFIGVAGSSFHQIVN